MKELKIKIWNIENVVLMKVLDQDESLRGKGKIYVSKNGFIIGNYGVPELRYNELYIFGDDDKIYCRFFINEMNAKEYIEKVKEAVAEYNASIREILDKEEKEYLRDVIRPFRNRIKVIKKHYVDFKDIEFIRIILKDDDVNLPYFKPNAMYKGMEAEREYTLEELEL